MQQEYLPTPQEIGMKAKKLMCGSASEEYQKNKNKSKKVDNKSKISSSSKPEQPHSTRTTVRQEKQSRSTASYAYDIFGLICRKHVRRGNVSQLLGTYDKS